MFSKLMRRALAALLLVVLTALPLDGQRSVQAPSTSPAGSLLGLGMDFVENRGQWDAPSLFVAQFGRMSASLERGAVRLRMAGEQPADLSLVFEGASEAATAAGEEPRSGVYNFFVGNDRRRWQSNVRAYGAVRYAGLYAGVDVRVLQRNGRLEYDVLLAPGAELEPVVIRTVGTTGLDVDAGGGLVLQTAAGPLRQSAPLTWEVLPDGTTRRLESRFRKIDAERYGFDVPARTGDLPVVIDPGLDWSTFLGGSNREEIHGLALTRDGSGDVVVAGHTWSSDFPTAPAGARGSSPLIPFVARINASGTALVYATLFGSTNGNVSFAFGLTLDAQSAPIVVGETNGADFPTTPGAYQPNFNEPSATINRGWDGFVTRFNPTATEMVFSTYLGAPPIFDSSFVGSKRGGDESARAVVVDSTDSVIVSGYTTSENFPTTAGAYDRTLSTLTVSVGVGSNSGTVHSRTDAFVSRLNSNGTQLTYSTFLGGQSDDVVRGMVIDGQDVLTLVGIEAPIETFNSQGNRTDHGIPFPTTPDAVARTHLGASDMFLARLSLDGTGAGDFKYGTILGGFYIDEASGIALDPNNPELVTIVGNTRSWDFPTTPGAWRRAPNFLADGHPYYMGHMMRFRFPAAGGGSLEWSSLITGEQTGQFADSVVIDPSGDVIVVGSDIAGVYPTTDRSFRRLPTKGSFVSRFSGDGTTLRYSTLLHKPSGVLVLRMKAVSVGPRAVVVAGATLLPDHPTTPGVFDRVFGSNGTSDGHHTFDGFVARLTLEPNTSADTTAAAPALLSPANGASIPLNSSLVLDWSDVADASGVQGYEVQVSANADFLAGFTWFNTAANVFTVSHALASTSQEGIHYWRVRTLDGANNFSPWSAVRRFTVGAPAWTNFAAVGLFPEAAVGGGTIQGTLHIQNVARAGGQVYTLTSSNPAAATVPASVTVPAGASSATFTVTTRSVSKSTPVQLTVWSEGNGDHPVLWVDPGTAGTPTAALSSLSVNPSSVAGGTSSTGTVTLSAAAPGGGLAVSLAANSAAVSIPASLNVPQGATSATFGITTTSVTSTTLVTLTATAGGISRSADLTVTTTGGGGGAGGFLGPTSNQADSGGDNNGFESGALNAHVEDGVVATDTNSGSGTSTSCTNTGKDRHRFFNFGFAIPDGSTIPGIEVRLRARADSTSGTPRMCVQLSWDGGTTWTAAKQTATLGTTLATFTLGGAADSWGRTWTPANLMNASFRLRIINVSSSTSRDFFLDSVAVRPHLGTPVQATLNAVSLSPASTIGGNSSTGTVTLTAPAPAGGAVIALTSSNAVATTPASATVNAGATSATFTVTTTAVTANTTAAITGSYAGLSRSATLTVTPPPPPATLDAVIVSPTSVTGGTSLQGIVTLTGAAPSGGAVIALSSSNPAAATVPATVTLPHGATGGSFLISTSAVATTTAVTIGASYGGVSRGTTLTVTSSGAGGGTAATLTVTATGRSGERVTSNPSGINVSVGSTGSASFTTGTSITLSVSNGRDAIWSGACSSNGNKTRTCTFTLNANASVSANVQ